MTISILAGFYMATLVHGRQVVATAWLAISNKFVLAINGTARTTRTRIMKAMKRSSFLWEGGDGLMRSTKTLENDSSLCEDPATLAVAKRRLQVL